MTEPRHIDDDDAEEYEWPELQESEGRDWLRCELAGWPYVTDRLHRFLDALHWRKRAAVVLTFGEKQPQEIIAYRLGVTPRTVRRDLADVYVLIEATMFEAKIDN